MTAPVENRGTPKPPLTVGIAGASASGKSRLAQSIAYHIDNGWVSHLDMDGYHVHSRGERLRLGEVPDQPVANDFALFGEHLRALRSGESIKMPVYNHEAGEFAGYVVRRPRRIILAEGLHAGLVNSLAGSCLVDIVVYIDVEEDVRKSWKVTRDVRERSYSYENAVQQVDKRLPFVRAHIYPQGQIADILLVIQATKHGSQSFFLGISEEFRQRWVAGASTGNCLPIGRPLYPVCCPGGSFSEVVIPEGSLQIDATLRSVGSRRLLSLFAADPPHGSYRHALRSATIVLAMAAVEGARK